MGISVTSTTPDPKDIMLTDRDFVFWLSSERLAQAIEDLTKVLREKR